MSLKSWRTSNDTGCSQIANIDDTGRGDFLFNVYCHDAINKRPVRLTGRLFLTQIQHSIHLFTQSDVHIFRHENRDQRQSFQAHWLNAFDFGNHQFAHLIGFARHWVCHHVFVDVGFYARLIAMDVN